MVKFINNLISCIVFIPTNSLLLSKGCFLLFLLKTRTCTEYTLKVLKFQYIIIYWFEGYDYTEKSCVRYNIWALRADRSKDTT